MRLTRRALLQMVVDMLIVVISLYLALWLRLDGYISSSYFAAMRSIAPFIVLIFIASFFSFRLYHRMWAYASIRELLAIVMAATTAAAITLVLVFLLDWTMIPRSVHIINWVLVIILVGTSRLGWRVFRDGFLRPESGERKRTLIVGAGDAGAMVAREMLSSGNGVSFVPVGFVDDDLHKRSLYLHGLKVLGNRADIPELVRRHRIENIIVAMPSVSGAVVREILDICQQTPARVKILPGMYQIIDGKVSINRIRDVELEDLLHRAPVRVDLERIAGYLHGKTVMVTGAGGSIGSELCCQICRFRPQKLVLLDNSENNLYEIDIELGEKFPGLDIVPCLADIKDIQRINGVFDAYTPQVVFHAAAFKHVPMMELHPAEALRNNVLGTRNVATAAHLAGTETFILISTDKAVNPTSVMGTTKRIAEMVIQSISANSQTRFAAVRFGNVLGSRGSVVPLFKRQIARGGPVTVTHPNMVRYFMTIPEAVQLVIQAGAMAQGGEIFVLDMGEPVKIVDLARDMIRLSGLRPDEDIQIKFTGTRPGEKLYEELLTDQEGIDATEHERILIAHADGNGCERVEHLLINKLQREASMNKNDIYAILTELVPEFRRPEKRQIG